MNHQITQKEIADQIRFHAVFDDRFKTNRISVNFRIPLDKEHVTEYAILPFLLRKKCKEYPDFTQLNTKLCDMYGAALDASVKKIGAWQVLSLSIRAIDNRYVLDQTDLTGECAKLLCALICDPCLENGMFEQSEVDLEKQLLIDEIASKINDKRGYAIDRCEEYLYCNEPYGIDEYGTIEAAKALTSKKITEAYHEMLGHAQIEIMFTGYGDIDAVQTVFEQRFAQIERKTPAEVKVAPVIKADQVREYEEQMDVVQSKLVMGFRTGSFVHSENINAMRLMAAIYGGTAFSRLFVYVRERLSLCYYCAARFDRIKGVLMVDSGVEQKNREVAQKEIINQLRVMQQGKFTDEEFAAAKLSMRNSFASITDSPAGIEAWYLVQVIAGTSNSPEQESTMLDAVTREQVMQAAQQVTLDTVYFLTSNRKDEVNA